MTAPGGVMPEPQVMTEFEFSRIYSQGWNAARTQSTAQKPVRNPYPSDPERERWRQGFMAGAV